MEHFQLGRNCSPRTATQHSARSTLRGREVWDGPTMIANGSGLALAAVQIALYCRCAGGGRVVLRASEVVPEI